MNNLIAGGMCLLIISSAQAAPPTWWTNPNTSIIDPSASHALADNYAPANLGQLKNVAKQAKKYLDANLSGGAGGRVNAMVAAFTTGTEDNYAPINLGQLKAVAKPFYDRLLSYGYPANAMLKAHGFPANWPYDTPWNPATPASENYAPANLGQLKAVFSFDLVGFAAGSLDSDGDGMPDYWEGFYFGTTGALPGGDADGDTISNLNEYLAGTDPTKTDSDGDGLVDNTETVTSAGRADSDSDLMPDSWEQALGPNPTVDNRNEDPDGDGMGRTIEHLSGRNSAVADSLVDSSDRALVLF